MSFFFLEIDLTSGYNTEIFARRSGDIQIENFMQPSARLLICTMWPPEAHEFDTPVLEYSTQTFKNDLIFFKITFQLF